MNLLRISAALVAVALGALCANVSVSQEAAPPAAAAPAEPAAAGGADAAETPPAVAPAAEADGEFIPSEEISADEEVTFPVDI